LNSVTESSNSKRRKFYFLIFVIGNVVEKESKEMSKTALFTIFDLKITLLCNYCTKKQKSDQKVLNKKKIKMLFFCRFEKGLAWHKIFSPSLSCLREWAFKTWASERLNVGKKERFTFSSIRLNSCSWNDLNQKCGLGLFETLLCCVEFKNFLICIFCDFVWIRAPADGWIEGKLKSPWRQILSIYSKLALNQWSYLDFKTFNA